MESVKLDPSIYPSIHCQPLNLRTGLRSSIHITSKSSSCTVKLLVKSDYFIDFFFYTHFMDNPTSVKQVKVLTYEAALIFIRLLSFHYFTQELRCLDTCSLFLHLKRRAHIPNRVGFMALAAFLAKLRVFILTPIGSCSWIRAWPLLYS